MLVAAKSILVQPWKSDNIPSINQWLHTIFGLPSNTKGFGPNLAAENPMYQSFFKYIEKQKELKHSVPNRILAFY